MIPEQRTSWYLRNQEQAQICITTWISLKEPSFDQVLDTAFSALNQLVPTFTCPKLATYVEFLQKLRSRQLSAAEYEQFLGVSTATLGYAFQDSESLSCTILAAHILFSGLARKDKDLTRFALEMLLQAALLSNEPSAPCNPEQFLETYINNVGKEVLVS